MPGVSDEAAGDLDAVPLPRLLSWFREDHADSIRSRAAVEILRRFEPLLRKYCRSLGRPVADYRDFVQEVMLRVLITLPRLRDPAAFPGLMRHIVINTSVDIWRKRGREDAERASSPQAPDPTTTFDKAVSTGLVLRSCLDMLPRRERQVMELLVVHECEITEVAHRLTMTDATVRMVKSRAIRRLRNALAQEI